MSDFSTQGGAGKAPPAYSPSFRSQLGPLLFLALIFFLNFIARIILSPLMPDLEADLGLDHSEAGVLFLLIAAGYVVTLMASGFVSSRLTHRNTIVLSSIALGVVLMATSLGGGLRGLRLGSFMIGMATGLYLPSGIATLTSLVDSHHWGKAISIHELAPNLAYVGAPLIAEGLLVWFSWRGVLFLVGVVSIVTGLIFARFSRGGDFRGEAPALGAFRRLLVEPSFWIITILFSIGISGTTGIYAMLPLYLVAERGMDLNRANALIALSRIPTPAMALFSGWATDRFGPRMYIMCSLLLTGIMTALLGLAQGIWIAAVVFLQSVLAVCFFPAGMAALSHIGPTGSRNVVVSFTIPFAFLVGGGVIPTFIGVMGDAGSFDMGIALVGILMLLGSFLASLLKLPPAARGGQAPSHLR